MTNGNISPEVLQLYSLLRDYSFDVDAYPMEAVIQGWLQEFDIIWVSHAVTEALYQGRYKIVSVEHILNLWQRRGHPIRHFNREFESIILGQSFLCYPEPPQVEAPKALLPRHDAAHRPSPEAAAQGNLASEPQPLGPSLPVGLSSETKAQQETSPGWGLLSAGERCDVTPPQSDLTHLFESAMPVPDFQAVPSPQSGDFYHSEPIRPFVPKREVSAMHQRLRAVVQAGAQR